MITLPPVTRSVMYRSPQDVVLQERPLRPLTAAETLIEVDACGICGTDIRALCDGSADYTNFGHEVAGRLNDGTPVVLESSSCCGKCSRCRNAQQELCENVVSFWPGGYFGFAEHMITPAISVVPYEGMAPEVACLSEPLGVALDMLRLVDLRPDSVVLVSGLGPIGLMAVRFARLAGVSRIYAVSRSHLTVRNDLARAYGADEILYEDKRPLADHPFAEAPDRFFVTAPPQVLPAMFDIAARGALLTYIGIAHGAGARVEFEANEFHFKKLQLRASYASPALFTPLALRLLREGKVDGASLITHRFGLDEMAEAVRVACFEKASCAKVVMVRH